MIENYEKELREIQEQMTSLKSREEAIKKAIKKEHKGTETTCYGGICVQMTNPYYTLELDTELLQQEQAEICDKYMKVVYKPSQTKIVLVKVKSDEEK